MSELVRRSSELDVVEVIDGELIETVWCPRCGDRHGAVRWESLGDSYLIVRCCCGDEHEVDNCCRCGHYHYGEGCKPAGPCGDYRCCINY
jgi:hypothetical protein